MLIVCNKRCVFHVQTVLQAPSTSAADLSTCISLFLLFLYGQNATWLVTSLLNTTCRARRDERVEPCLFQHGGRWWAVVVACTSLVLCSGFASVSWTTSGKVEVLSRLVTTFPYAKMHWLAGVSCRDATSRVEFELWHYFCIFGNTCILIVWI